MGENVKQFYCIRNKQTGEFFKKKDWGKFKFFPTPIEARQFKTVNQAKAIVRAILKDSPKAQVEIVNTEATFKFKSVKLETFERTKQEKWIVTAPHIGWRDSQVQCYVSRRQSWGERASIDKWDYAFYENQKNASTYTKLKTAEKVKEAVAEKLKASVDHYDKSYKEEKNTNYASMYKKARTDARKNLKLFIEHAKVLKVKV